MSVFAHKGANVYRQTEAQSRTPLELVVMLYDGALRFTAQARTATERNDTRARRAAISRVLAIMSELQSTLDIEKGGAIAKSLDALYVYIIGRLVQGSSTQDLGAIDDARRVLTTLREAWVDIAQPAASAMEVAR